MGETTLESLWEQRPGAGVGGGGGVATGRKPLALPLGLP